MIEQAENTRQSAAAYRILTGEFALTGLFALFFWVLSGGVAAYSSLLGGLAYIVPNIFFVMYAFKYSAAESAPMALGGLFIGESLKLVATAILFALCFVLVKPLHVVALFATFVTMVLMNLAAIAKIMS